MFAVRKGIFQSPRPDGQARAVPVRTQSVAARDIPIFLEGLGTVTPLATVAIRAQVTGRLVSVAFREGQVLRKGSLLAQVDPRPFQAALDQALATQQRDQAQLDNAELLLKRSVTLREQKLISDQALDDQRAQAAQLRGTLAIDNAAIASARLQLEYAQLLAPIDGLIGIRQVDPGNLVSPSDSNPLALMTQMDPISVVFSLPQDDLAQLRDAMRAGEVPVTAIARDGATEIARGKLSVIDNQISATTGTVRMRAIFPNPNRDLWPNQFVNARVTVAVRKQALVTVAEAVQQGPEGPFVYTVSKDNKATVSPVEIDVTVGSVAVLKSGLRLGDSVVVEGQAQLRPGLPVEPVLDAAGPSAASGTR